MSYKIIGDSCSDFTDAMKKSPLFQSIPLTLEIGDYHVQDDENFQQKDFLRRGGPSPIGPKTACPSPEAYRDAIEKAEADEIYIVTLSEHLSGSYQAAVVGLQMYEEGRGEDKKRIHIFGSDSASAGQCNLCLYIQELKEENADFDTVVKRIEEKIQSMKTYFVLESLETLRKNGRLSTVKSFLASALNIKPVMGAVHGVIVKLDQQRGSAKALKRMAQIAVEKAGGPESCKELRLVISHVNDRERAEFVREEFLRLASFREIVITEAQGVATVYANDRGIVVAL